MLLPIKPICDPKNARRDGTSLIYLQYCYSATNRTLLNTEIADENRITQLKEWIYLINDLVIHPDDNEVLSKGPEILTLINPLCETASKLYPPKKSISEIAEAYNTYCREHPGHSTEYGVQYGWLNKLIDCTRLYREPIPAHSKVGTFFHAGKFIIEESIILRDAFFFLVKAEIELENLISIEEKFKSNRQQPAKEDLNRAYVLNSNVGTYCRTSLLTQYSFIEAYINGIGSDYLWNNTSQLSEKDKKVLTGTDGKNYISLEKKLEKYHLIIRGDGNKQFVTTSKEQLKEPFTTFLNECKEIRNSSVHYSPQKAQIIRKPHEWHEKANHYAKVSLEVARVFWHACYPGKKYPDYLDLLDYDILMDIAKQRVAEKAN